MKLGQKFHAIILTGLLVTSSQALAQTEIYRARLSPMPTTPQTVDEILGEGEVILTLQGNTLSVAGNFSGMSSAATMAHIHNGPPAQPGPVMFQLELTTNGNGGELSAELELTDEQLQALQSNSLYVQIHSENNPPGELRGWIFIRSHFDNL